MDDQAKEVQRVLDAVDAVAAGEPPAERARRLAEMLESVRERVRQERRQAMQEMKDGGMTLRQIAAELDISFGRVRQILAEESDPSTT
ncbi:sigma factor-like helix-turn-helix DNA-binding protein [Streptomyces virginiae]|uniref:sigma factor-like helix-turn-helix DNA-binding protein n=1 Tax=Streptomyces virginiae TaxID=1961 RepID=UPI0036A37F7B